MDGNSLDGAGFRERLFLAWSLWQGRRGRRLSQTALGEMVGDLRGQKVPQSTVSDWFNAVVPGVEDMEQLAKALDCDPGWLAFGPASAAPGPENHTIGLQQPVPPPKRR